MKWKAVIIVLIIILALLPMYALYQYLQRMMRPKESGSRFIGWLLLNFLLIFSYTFLVVFLIRLLFPGA